MAHLVTDLSDAARLYGLRIISTVGEARIVPPSQRTKIRSAADVWQYVAPLFDGKLQEEMVAIPMDAQMAVILEKPVEITRGILNSSLVHTREVFRPAIAVAAAAIIIAHNHPSGDPTPSGDDRAVTDTLVTAGRLLDIPVIDHIVCGADRHVSFAEAGLL
jgi:DNA repair protein RadC